MNRTLPAALMIVLAVHLSRADEVPSAPHNLQAENQNPETSVDLLTGAIDPFAEGTERAKFWNAAGVDSELDESEFKADQATGEGFVRSFDSWPLMLKLDQNRNKAIDWFEARDYRRAILVVFLAKHDKNKDGRLTAREREEVNNVLWRRRLAEYFDIPCCGGKDLNGKNGAPQIVSPIQPRGALKDLLAEHQRRKDHLSVFSNPADELPDEERWLPFKSVTHDDVVRSLNLDNNPEVCALMPEQARRQLETFVFNEVNWTLSGDQGAFCAKMDAVHLFLRGQPAPDGTPEAYQQTMQMLVGMGALVYRLGFAADPIKIAQGNPIAALPEQAVQSASTKPEILSRLDREQPIICVKMAARYTPVFVGDSNNVAARREDEFGTLMVELIYDKSAAFPFFILRSGRDIPQRSGPEVSHSPSDIIGFLK